MATYINPKTGKPLPYNCGAILEWMGGLWSSGTVAFSPRKWPISGVNFGAPSLVCKSMAAMEKAGLIRLTVIKIPGETNPYFNEYEITDLGLAVLAPTIERMKANRAASEARQKAEQEKRDAERRKQEAEAERVRRIVEAHPALVAALRMTRDYMKLGPVDSGGEAFDAIVAALAKVEGL